MDTHRGMQNTPSGVLYSFYSLQKFEKQYLSIMRKLTVLLALVMVLLIQSCSKDDGPTFKESSIYETDFSKDDGRFWLGILNGAKIDIQEGYYYFTNSDKSGIYFSSLKPLFESPAKNAAIETRISITGLSKNNPGAGGLVWGLKTSDNSQYRFQLNGFGKFLIYGVTGDEEIIYYQDWTRHDAIKYGSGVMNTIRMELRSEKLYFYVNGTEVFNMDQVNNGIIDNLGYCSSYETTLKADYFKVYKLD